MNGFYNPAMQDTMRNGYNANYRQQIYDMPVFPNAEPMDSMNWWNNIVPSYNEMGYMGRDADWGSIPQAAGYGMMGPVGMAAGRALGALAQRMQPGMPITQGQMANMQQMLGSSPQQQVMNNFGNPDSLNWRRNFMDSQISQLEGIYPRDRDDFGDYLPYPRPMDVEKL